MPRMQLAFSWLLFCCRCCCVDFLGCRQGTWQLLLGLVVNETRCLLLYTRIFANNFFAVCHLRNLVIFLHCSSALKVDSNYKAISNALWGRSGEGGVCRLDVWLLCKCIKRNVEQILNKWPLRYCNSNLRIVKCPKWM